MIRPSSLRRVMLCYLEGDGRADGGWMEGRRVMGHGRAKEGKAGACLGTCPANPIPLAQGTGAARRRVAFGCTSTSAHGPHCHRFRVNKLGLN